MSFKFYKISRFCSDEHMYESSWIYMSDFIKKYGVSQLHEFLATETSFIKFLKMFYTYLNENYEEHGYSRLASQIILADNLDNDKNSLMYYGFDEEDVKGKLYYLSKFNLVHLNNNEVDFLFKCWVRGLCNLYLFDIATNSSLKSLDDNFYYSLILNEELDITEIFSQIEGVYVYVHYDYYTIREDYEIPADCGDRVSLLKAL